MPIMLKSEAELDAMREAGRIVGQTLAGIREMVRPGLNLLEVEAFVKEEFRRHGAVETFRGYDPAGKPPYPSNVCASVNDEPSLAVCSYCKQWKAGRGLGNEASDCRFRV